MSDYRLTIKVTNARIKRAMREAGLETNADLARAAGVSASETGDIINLKVPAKRPNGSWRKAVLLIADALNKMPEELFSKQQQISGLKRNAAEVDFEEAAIAGFLETEAPALITQGGDDALEIKDELELLDRVMREVLNPREQTVIKRRFGLEGGAPKTLAEVGESLGGVHRERVSQIEAKAIRKLRIKMFKKYGNSNKAEAQFSKILNQS